MLCTVHPLVTLVMTHGCFALAWMSLGSRPQPSWHDPNSIAILVIAYPLTMLAVGLVPGMAMCGVCALLLMARHARLSSIAVRGTLLILFLLLFFRIARSDPLEVMRWLGD